MRLGKGRRHKKTVNSGTMSEMGEREGGKKKKTETGALPLRDFSPPPPSTVGSDVTLRENWSVFIRCRTMPVGAALAL